LVFLTLALCCVLLLRRRSAAPEDRLLVRAVAGTALLLVALTWSVWFDADQGTTPWLVVYHAVPGAKAIRCTARVYLIVYPLLTAAGLAALQRLLDLGRVSAARRTALVGALLAVAAVENYFPQRDNPDRSFEAEAFYGHARSLAAEMQGADAAYGLSE